MPGQSIFKLINAHIDLLLTIYKVLDGELIETRFAWPEDDQLLNSGHEEMHVQSKAKLGLNEVQYITGKFNISK